MIDELLTRNKQYAQTFPGAAPVAPALHLAVVACMDSRLDVHGALGLKIGDAHVMRNAGGIVTDDMIRSLVISQRLLGTREIILIHHTDCGMLKFTEDEMKDAIEADTGLRPPWATEAFTSLDRSVRNSIARLRKSPFVPYNDRIRGFVFDVSTALLREVDLALPSRRLIAIAVAATTERILIRLASVRPRHRATGIRRGIGAG